MTGDVKGAMARTLQAPILLFFTNSRSGPARRMESLLAHLARKERSRLRVARIDAEMQPEWIERLQAVGLMEDHTCDLPMTQAELGDALGISTVHVNRVLQELRGDALISLKGSTLKVLFGNG